MTSSYDPFALHDRELADFGHARARDIAFDAIHKLWERRRSEGMTQAELANKIGRDPAWVSRNLRAPGNWTLRTLGELVVALDGCLEIHATAAEDARDECSDREAEHESERSFIWREAQTEKSKFRTFAVAYLALPNDTAEDQCSGFNWLQPKGCFDAVASTDTAHGWKGQNFMMRGYDASTPHNFMPEVPHARR
jgi:transcriptional regulator with XRE-family HTH domain